MLKTIAVWLAVSGALAVTSSFALASTCTFVGADNATWATAGNWDCGATSGPPGASDDVVISAHSATTPGTDPGVNSYTVSASALTLTSAVSTVNFTISGGTVTGGTVTVSGAATRSGGTLNAPLTVASGATAAISGGNGTGAITNHGTATLLGGQLFDVVNDGTLEAHAASIIGTVTNSGAINKTTSGIVSTGHTAVTAGTVTLSAGLWHVGGANTYTQSGGTTVLAGGVLAGDNGLTFSGGTLSGNGEIEGVVTVNGTALVEPGGVGAIGSIAIAGVRTNPAFGGSYTQTGGTLHIERNGVLPGRDYDRLLAIGTYQVSGTSVLQIDDLTGFTANAGDAFTVLTASAESGTPMFASAAIGVTSTTPTYADGGVTVGGSTSHEDLHSGDMFFTEAASFLQRSASGQALRYFPPESNSFYLGGLPCSDSAGNVYIPRPNSNALAKYDKSGALVAAKFYDGGSNPAIPYGCRVTSSGTIYLNTNDGIVLQLDATGALTKTITDVSLTATKVALLADDCTLVGADDGLQAYNVCTGTAVTTYTGFAATGCAAITLHPDGDLFVACISGALTDGAVYRLHGGAAIAQTYTADSMQLGTLSANSLTNLAIDPSGTSFWVGADKDQAQTAAGTATSAVLSQIDITSGAVLKQMTVPSTSSRSLFIYGAVSSGTSGGASAGAGGGSSSGASTGSSSGAGTPVTPPTTTPPTPKKGCNSGGAASLLTLFAVAVLLSRKHRG